MENKVYCLIIDWVVDFDNDYSLRLYKDTEKLKADFLKELETEKSFKLPDDEFDYCYDENNLENCYVYRHNHKYSCNIAVELKEIL